MLLCEKANDLGIAYSKDSDQPRPPPSLISVLAVCLMGC